MENKTEQKIGWFWQKDKKQVIIENLLFLMYFVRIDVVFGHF